MEPTRILVAGDTHCNPDTFRRLKRQARELDCDAIFQVGDFGYDFRDSFIDVVTEVAAQTPVYWIDGNHDNHDKLEAWDAFDAEGFQEIWPKVFYVPRGHGWTWNGVKFVGVGGAHSIDKRHRTPHVSWWEQERVTNAQAERAMAHEKCDVLLVHDVPTDVPYMDRYVAGYKDDIESAGNRRVLTHVTENLQPTLLIHGHMHHRYEDWFRNETLVIGLDRDTMEPDNTIVLDLSRWNQIASQIQDHQIPFDLLQ